MQSLIINSIANYPIISVHYSTIQFSSVYIHIHMRFTYITKAYIYYTVSDKNFCYFALNIVFLVFFIYIIIYLYSYYK